MTTTSTSVNEKFKDAQHDDPSEPMKPPWDCNRGKREEGCGCAAVPTPPLISSLGTYVGAFADWQKQKNTGKNKNIRLLGRLCHPSAAISSAS